MTLKKMWEEAVGVERSELQEGTPVVGRACSQEESQEEELHLNAPQQRL